MENLKSLFRDFSSKIDNLMHNIDEYKQIYGIESEIQADRELNEFEKIRTGAYLGIKKDKEYIIKHFVKLLKHYYIEKRKILTGDKINKYIDFEDLSNNDVVIQYEILMYFYDISEIIENNGFYDIITAEDVKTIMDIEKDRLKAKLTLNDKLEIIARIFYAKKYGMSAIDSLEHNKINEIGVRDKNYIYIVYKGRKILLDFLKFEDVNEIITIQKKITENSSYTYDEMHPVIIANKNNANRVSIAGYKATATDEEWYINERIFNLDLITLEEMRDKYNTINQLIYDLLIVNQLGRGSHLVTGADMGVGKSTFLVAMMEKIPDRWGIGIIDTQNELQAVQKFPRKNIYTFIQSDLLDVNKAFEYMLKMARDILYVGEITMPEEMAQLINCMLRLNSGAGATLHSASPYEVIDNARNLLLRSDMYDSSEVAERDIAKGLELIIHLARLESGRIVVESICEVEYIEKDIYIDLNLNGSRKERISNLINLAQLALHKYLYPKSYRIRELIKFDRQKNDWVVLNTPTDKYIQKRRLFNVDEKLLQKLIKDFKENIK